MHRCFARFFQRSLWFNVFQIVYCKTHVLYSLIHGKNKHEKETYCLDEILTFEVSQEEIEETKTHNFKCSCFPWVFMHILLNSFYRFSKFGWQIDYCGEHKIYWKCSGFGSAAVQETSPPKKVAEFWEPQPREGHNYYYFYVRYYYYYSYYHYYYYCYYCKLLLLLPLLFNFCIRMPLFICYKETIGPTTSCCCAWALPDPICFAPEVSTILASPIRYIWQAQLTLYFLVMLCFYFVLLFLVINLKSYYSFSFFAYTAALLPRCVP